MSDWETIGKTDEWYTPKYSQAKEALDNSSRRDLGIVFKMRLVNI